MDGFHVQFQMRRAHSFGNGPRRRPRDLAAVGRGLIGGGEQCRGQSFGRWFFWKLPEIRQLVFDCIHSQFGQCHFQ